MYNPRLISLNSIDNFLFNDTKPTYLYTLSLHDALPICSMASAPPWRAAASCPEGTARSCPWPRGTGTGRARWPLRRSEEHTSELQSHVNLVCRLLLEKKKQQ